MPRPSDRPGGRPSGPVVHDEPAGAAPEDAGGERGRCTQAQLRRFIKSRPYIPMHELRRRFDLGGGPDDVSPVRTANGTIWVGLPPREAGFVGDLLRQGEIGAEMSHDPEVAVVVGLFAMRPVTR
ncbi:MAG: hypothetical protein ACKOTZ_03130 [Chloroflexota bacterium]